MGCIRCGREHKIITVLGWALRRRFDTMAQLSCLQARRVRLEIEICCSASRPYQYRKQTYIQANGNILPLHVLLDYRTQLGVYGQRRFHNVLIDGLRDIDILECMSS